MASDLMNPAQCNICEAAAAKFSCNTCGDALCATCKVHHLKSKGTKHHKIVPYAEKLNPKYLAALLCPKHQTHGPTFWCNTCGIQICNSCIISPEHKGHEYSDITVTLSERRDAMLAEMKTLRDQRVGEWEAVLKQAKTMTTEYQSNIDKVGMDLVARAKEMHKQVENILETSQKTLQQMTTSGLAKLQQQEKYLEDKLRQMKEDVERYENQLRDADPNAVLRFEEDPGQSKEKTKPPVLDTQSPPVFVKGQIDTNAIESMFGQFSIGKIPQKSTEVDNKPPASSEPSTQPEISSDIGKTTVRPSVAHSAGNGTRSLIPNPSVQHQFDVHHWLPHTACVERDLAWVQNGWKILQMEDRDGTIRKTINTDFFIYGMAVTSDGDILLTDRDNSCIKLVTKGRISTLFSTSWVPGGLCCLQSNDIVVTFGGDSKGVIYSSSGQIRQTLDHIQFRWPMSVSENKVNQDIYICDKEGGVFDSAGKVIAVAADGKYRYQYTGQGESEFTPMGICTDQMGHVLITDFDNHCVHILDQEGHFIQYILTSQHGLHKPNTIDVDKEGHVWVGNNGCVKVARYLQ